MTTRQVACLIARYRAEGPQGLVSRQRGHPSNHQLDEELVQHVLELIPIAQPELISARASSPLTVFGDRPLPANLTTPMETQRDCVVSRSSVTTPSAGREPNGMWLAAANVAATVTTATIKVSNSFDMNGLS
jgi:hypothetical protein